MRGVLFLAIAFFLIFSAACSSEITAKPLTSPLNETSSQQVQAIDPCKKVKCAAPMVCEEGECKCPEEQKKCSTTCIPETGCCEDADCDEGKCISNECKTVEECSYGEQFQDGKCACAEDYKYCTEQKKCISQKSCCTYLNCGPFQDCVRTTYGVSLCMKSEQKRSCKFVSDNGREELFNLGNGSISAKAIKFMGQKIEFKIENQTITLQPDVHTNTMGIEIWQENFEVMGGFCRQAD